MFPLRSVLCLLLACASAVAQIPLVASDHEIREVALTKLVDPATISAKLTNGVLHVTVGKSPEAQPKRIEVK